METEFLQALEAQRPCIRSNWEHLLRIERINSPLANPDTLVHLLDITLNEIFQALRVWSPRRFSTRAGVATCPCGRNPLLAYFSAGRQAMREALVLAQAITPSLTPRQRDEGLACLEQVFGQIAQREIGSFCAICQFRTARPPAHAPARTADKPPTGALHLEQDHHLQSHLHDAVA